MSEKLIPFNFEAFKADPSRLRYLGRAPACASVACGNCVAALWDNGDGGSIFTPDQFRYIRLAAKTVKVRLYRDPYDGKIFVVDEGSVDLNLCPINWCSDIVEIPVTA